MTPARDDSPSPSCPPSGARPSPSWGIGILPAVVATTVVASVLAIVGATSGCAKDPVYASGSGGSAATGAAAGTGGAGASGGAAVSTGGQGGGVLTAAGGRAETEAPACDPANSGLHMITAPGPLISVGRPVRASTGVLNAGRVVDAHYDHAGMTVASSMLPGWLAIELVPGPEQLLLTWADVGWTDYNAAVSGGSPGAYTIDTSGDSSDGADGTWETVVAVAGNTVRERAHRFPFGGKRWVRMSFTAAASTAANAVIAVDEIALYDVTASGAGLPGDSWFFMGDSITVNAFRRQFVAGTSFDAIVHAARPAFSPAMVDGGIGGELSAMGLGHLATWLTLNPDVRNIALLYGTNDSWGDRDGAVLAAFENNMNAMAQMVLDAGRIPILARIPYSAVAKTTLPKFNAVVDRISTARGLPCGPDLYGWFRDHPDELSSDGVHPTEVGYRSMNRLWAEAMLGRYPAPR